MLDKSCYNDLEPDLDSDYSEDFVQNEFGNYLRNMPNEVITVLHHWRSAANPPSGAGYRGYDNLAQIMADLIDQEYGARLKDVYDALADADEAMKSEDDVVVSEEEVIKRLRKWLGADGLKFFREIKDKHGEIDAIWMLEGGIPHLVHFREGMQIRNFLRGIYGRSWTDHEYDERWVDLVEKAIAYAD